MASSVLRDNRRRKPVKLVADPGLNLVFGQMMRRGNIDKVAETRAGCRREPGAEKPPIRETAVIGIAVFHAKYPIVGEC